MQDLRERIDAAKLPEHVAEGRHARGRSPRTHVAGVARISDDPHLHRLGARRPLVEDDRGSAESGRSAPRARRGPLRPRQGQGAHRRIPRRAQAEGGHERSHPLLRRPSGRRQDVARPVDRARDEPRVRAHLARRRARRSGDPRPSPHLHRLDARPPDSGAETGGLRQSGVHARRDRQDVGRLSGRSGGGAARSARSGAEPQLPRSLSGSPVRSLARAVHRDGESARPGPSGAARPHGDHLARPATPKRTRSTSRAATCCRVSSAKTACRRRRSNSATRRCAA